MFSMSHFLKVEALPKVCMRQWMHNFGPTMLTMEAATYSQEKQNKEKVINMT
jgi:hypothetical protein